VRNLFNIDLFLSLLADSSEIRQEKRALFLARPSQKHGVLSAALYYVVQKLMFDQSSSESLSLSSVCQKEWSAHNSVVTVGLFSAPAAYPFS